MVNRCYFRLSTLRFLRFGPLGRHIDAFAEWLIQQDYSPQVLRYKIRWVAYLSHWLHQQRLGVDSLDEQRVERFLHQRRNTGGLEQGNRTTFRDLLRWLRAAGAIAPASSADEDTALSRLEKDFVSHLTRERGLVEATVKNYLPTAQCFLSEQCQDNPARLKDAEPRHVTAFIQRQLKTTSLRRLQLVLTALRVFFRFLRLRGLTSVDLAAAVSAVSNRRRAEWPKFISPKQVQQLLDSCDRRQPVGRRDFAILLLLARLGLRAGEVLALTLEDIDWETGVLTIRGKGRRVDQLPLPPDVGKALVDYLRHGRPRCATRRLFVRSRAPFRELARNSCVCTVVRYACARAGLSPPQKGAHLLRHSLATNMLRRGASLREIGEVLRHRQPNTTEIYAKVDLEALKTVAQPWIGGKP
jgi:site-specific recombinase XerD